MDTRSLRYFLAVAEFASYSRAAKHLGISQPALSRQVGRLEKTLERPLFIRRGHGVDLTAAGERLVERSRIILRQLQEAATEVRDHVIEPSGTLTLAVPPAAGNFLVPALAEQLAKNLPRVSLKVVAGYSSYIREWLVRGLVDLACLHDPLPLRGFSIVPLVQEEVFLVGRPGMMSPGRKWVRAADLAGVSLILPSLPNASRRLIDGWAARAGITLDVRMEVDDTTIIRSLLRQGVGVSLLSQGAIQGELLHGELIALPFRPRVHWPLALVSPIKAAPLADAVAKLISEIVGDLVDSGGWPGHQTAV